MSALFPPTLEAAHARLDAVDPQAYARSRNYLDGSVTRLSPYYHRLPMERKAEA